MILNLPAIVEKGFTLEAIEDEVPRVRFSGNGDTEAVASLNRFLKHLHQELVAHDSPSVAVDFEELYFMNSSCLKAFVSWIYKVDTTGRPYQIRLLMNPRLHWQSRSLATLQRLAPLVVQVEALNS